MAASGGVSLEHTESDSETIKKSDQQKTGTSSSEYVASTSGSTNTTTNSGSVNTAETINSGSTNVSTVGPSTVVVGPRDTSSTTSTSEQVNTSQLLLTEDAVNYMVKGILEGTSGLASTLSGGAQSGVYNSATTTLLGNDLLARTAGEVAARAAVTKTVIGGTTSTTSGKDSGYTTTDSGKSVTEIIGGSKSTSSQNIGGSTVTELIGGQTATGKTGSKSAEDVILNENVKSESSSTTGKVEAKVGWIVCTELTLQGRMPKKFYMYGVRVFMNYDEATHRGYYLWAVPALEHLKKYPHSLLSRFLELTLNARAEYIAAEGGCKGARKTVLGFVTKHLRWVCWALGHTVAKNQKPKGVSDATLTN